MNTSSRETLQRITQNCDSNTTILRIGTPYTGVGVDDGEFNSREGTDFSNLGVAIGKNNHLTGLHIDLDDDDTALDVSNRDFYDGLKRNTSITSLLLRSFRGVEREILKAFQENNNLTRICVSCCSLDNGVCRVITKALRQCTNLKFIEVYYCNVNDDQLVRITESVTDHRMLEQFKFGTNRISNVGCEALVTSLLNDANYILQTLDLQGNNIGTTGCEAITKLLRDPNCNLETIILSNNAIDDVGATAITSSLSNNKHLKKLYLTNNPMNEIVQDLFLDLLCDTTSINATYHSNHTLDMIKLQNGIGGEELYGNRPSYNRITWLLYKLNKGRNKSLVAIKKIIGYHPKIDMSPLYNLDLADDDKNLKALPYVINWFDRAREAVEDYDEIKVERRKLASIYQFVGDMPLLFVPTPRIKLVCKKRKRKGNIHRYTYG